MKASHFYSLLLSFSLLSGIAAQSVQELGTPQIITAYKAKKISENSIPSTVMNNVIQIYGDRSKLSPHPRTWRILFWDPSAEQNVRAGTVTGERVIEVKSGYVELEKLRLAAYKPEEVVMAGALMVDSNQALEKVIQAMQLQKVTLSSVEYWLKKAKDASYPVWYLTLFIERGGQEIEIGNARMSAQTGEIFECVLKKDEMLK